MMLLERGELRDLMEFRAKEGNKILTLYLNIDPLKPSNARGGFKVVLQELLNKAEKQAESQKEEELFAQERSLIERYVEHLIPKQKTLVAFLDTEDGLQVMEQLPVEIPNQVYFRDYPVLRPILELLDSSETYLLCSLDREKARFLRLFLGTVTELKEISSQPPVKHRQTSGTDHMRSQMVLQRRAAAWSNRFLKEAAEEAWDLYEKHAIDQLILAGTEEAVSEFRRILPRNLSQRIIGQVKLPTNAKPQDIMEACYPIIKEREQRAEEALVTDLVTSAQKGDKAVLGVNATINAINEGRVYLLIYPNGYSIEGFRCSLCEVILDHIPQDGKCPYCQERCHSIENLILEASEKVFEIGGKVIAIKEPVQIEKLVNSGILGAFLR